MHTRWKSKHILAVLIAVLTVIVFLPALNNDFVNWDDDKNVYDNTFIHAIDTHFLTKAFFDYPVDYWRPLAWLSHAADYALWGLDPRGHHLTSIILHGLNTLLVVLLAIRLLEAWRTTVTGPRLPDKAILIAAGTTGLLFGIHPLHVESVVWISERKDLLCALFFLLSILHYEKHAASAPFQTALGRATPRVLNRPYLLAVGFFSLAVSSKPMAVTLPVVLLILDWFPLGRIRSVRSFLGALVEKLPFIALSMFASVLAVTAQQAVGAVRTTEFAPLAARVAVAAKALVVYLYKMVLPLNLVPFYPYPKDVSILSLGYFMPIVLVMGITMTCIVLRKRSRLLISAWSYYVITLLPVLGLVQVGSQSMADRYTYLPSLGPFLVIGVGAAMGLLKSTAAKQGRPIIRIVGGTMVFCIIAAFIALSVKQIGIWRNSLHLWDYVIEHEPADASIAYYNRAHAFREHGRLDRAIADYDMVLALSPSDYKAHYERGMLFEQSGQIDKAVADYDRTIVLNPSYIDALISRGVLYGKEGSFEKAIAYFTRSIAVDPKNVESYNNRGIAYVLTGQFREALEDFTRAVVLDEKNGSVLLNRGRLYLRTGNRALAFEDFQKACELGNAAGCGEARALGL